MGAVTERAAELAGILKAAGAKRVYTKIAEARPPCILVVPVPDWTFELAGSSARVTWTLQVLGPLPADLKCAEQMEELVLLAAGVLPIEAARPSSYQTSTSEDPLPSYALTMTDEVEF